MEDKFTVARCREILKESAVGLTDKELEELRDFYITFSDYVIDTRIERLKLNEIDKKYANQKTSP